MPFPTHATHYQGATYFGIAAVVSSICDSIFGNKRNVRLLSVFSPEHGVCTSFPCVLGSAGVDRIVPLHQHMNESERVKFDKSVASLKAIITEYEPKLMG
jgi:malate/lactate dehydrogenase